MKKTSTLLAAALACAFIAPAFASIQPTTSIASPDQVLAKKGAKKPGKTKVPKAPRKA